MPKSLLLVGLGVGSIWLLYFLLGGLIARIYAAGEEDASQNNKDFV